jgi:NADH dehydrogenase (ubiquinone) 1 alpha subcomplex subunit 9
LLLVTMTIAMTMFAATRATARQNLLVYGRRSLSNFYSPKLTERRVGEAGSGGHSSEAGVKVALFGASGFLGNYVCGELGANGFMAYLANRGDDMEMRHLKIPFDLGRTRFQFYSPRDRDSIKEVIQDADVVVNMIGKYYESGQPIQTAKFPYVGYRTNYSFADANVEIPRTLAEICLEMQVDHFVHVSSASASPDARSEWSRTKYAGEQAIKEVYPWATIIRPTQFFGKQDRFLHWFARMAKWYRIVPLVDGGKTLTQPVWAGDVAKTILKVCDNPSIFEGRQIDCFGPAEFSYSELADFVNDITERNRPVFNLPYDYYAAIAKVLQYQRDPLITPDLVEIWSEDFLPSMPPEEYKLQKYEQTKILTMQDLGIEPTPIEKIAFEFMQIYRAGGHFARVQGYH